MARLASQEKLGYYKTPVSIIKRIKESFVIEPGSRFFDPCCGDGEALSILKENANIETLGVELEKGRFLSAKEKLDRVYWADAIVEVKMSPGSVDLLFLNPPYDYDDGEEYHKRERLELFFLKKYLPAIVQKGWLIFIIPVQTLKLYDIRIMLSRLADLSVFRFPDGEFEKFKQIVVIGRKKRLTRDAEKVNFRHLNAFILDEDLSSWPTTDEIPTIQISKNTKEKFLFEALHIDPETLTPLTDSLKQSFVSSVSITMIKDIHPLMPLRKGHMAMLIAAGYLNGEIKKGETHLIVKGTLKKEEVARDESTATHDVTIVRQRDSILIRALNMQTGTIEEIK